MLVLSLWIFLLFEGDNLLKRIIFDVDDTLIPWTNKYFKGFRKHIKENGIELGIIKYYKLLMSIEKYEYTHTCWKKDELVSYMEQVAGIKFPDNSYELVVDWLNGCVIGTASDELIDTLKYLSKKYELVVLSNSFESVQINRMKKFGIFKYFKKVYGGDDCMKPASDAYLKALGKYRPNECMIVGDNLEFDVIEPSKLGIRPIYVSKKKNKEFITVKNVTELKDIL